MKDRELIKIAIVKSRFNEEVTEALETGTMERLLERGIDQNHLTLINVPGAFEIPLIAKQLARSGQYDAIICLGSVIRGETSHYDYVCEQVSRGCQDIMLAHDTPVIFGVLTTDNFVQAMDRVGGEHGHKGFEAAETALEMIDKMGVVEEMLQHGLDAESGTA